MGKEGREKKKTKRENWLKILKGKSQVDIVAQYRQNVFSLVNNLIYTNKNCN